jgi:hypothetical protein
MSTTLTSLADLQQLPLDALEGEASRLDELARLARALLTARRRAARREAEYQELLAAGGQDRRRD